MKLSIWKNILSLLIIILFSACGKNETQTVSLNEFSNNKTMFHAYQEGEGGVYFNSTNGNHYFIEIEADYNINNNPEIILSINNQEPVSYIQDKLVIDCFNINNSFNCTINNEKVIFDSIDITINNQSKNFFLI
jgi:hypothetical protein